jgi:hypothetical protein
MKKASIQTEKPLMKKYIVSAGLPLFILVGLLTGLAAPSKNSFVPAPLPSIETVPSSNAPVYVFLFTHTEDHINHAYSENRYKRIAPKIAEMNQLYPNSHIVWTIEFQGADAKTISDRNSSTKIKDGLKNYANQGLIEFGYHAQHDPTYMNRPQNLLTDHSSWETVVNAFDSWITCEKNPLYGGCVNASGGGLQAVQNNFGDVQIVTGLGINENGLIESDEILHAVRKYLPNRILGFGFSDHSPVNSADYSEHVDELMSILTPNHETSASVFWMNDVLRLNNSDPLRNVSEFKLRKGKSAIQSNLNLADRTRPNIFGMGLADKYIYTVEGQSPTQYAYSHPTKPQLPSKYLNKPAAIEKNYQNTFAALKYLAAEFMPANAGSRFMNASAIINLAAPDDFWAVTREELDVIARWVILNWGTQPPNYVSDGKYFYSLRDAFGLLALALANDYPETISLQKLYGPFESAPSSAGLSVLSSDIYNQAEEIAAAIQAGNSNWQITPLNQIHGNYVLPEGRVNAAQMLYAMAMVYASTYAGTPLTEVAIPETQPMPATLTIMNEMGCDSCEDSAWSLKPARLKD